MAKETVKKENQKELSPDSLKKKTSSFFYKFTSGLSSIRYILIWYVLISFVGTILLWLPISHKGGGWNVSFLDALFMSSSSFSDTGLSTLPVSETFNTFGKLVTLILLNIGGVGLFTIKIFFLKYILRKKLSFSKIADSTAEVGTNNKSETIGLIFSSIIVSVFSTILFGIIFGILFATVHNNPILDPTAPDPELFGNWGKSIWTGFYHASASVNNSGLDIFSGDTSMAAFSGNITIQVMTVFLFVIGGIGFGVFYDVFNYITSKKTGEAFSFSLLTKISVVTYLIISLAGLSLVFISEGLSTINNPNAFLSGDNTGYKSLALAFNTFSTRNAGFSTINLGSDGGLNPVTTLIQGVMMFIGSGPGSTAGGLRTTTFAVIAIVTWSSIRGKQKPHVFNRAIPEETIRVAITIFLSSIILIFSEIIIISLSESVINAEKHKSILDFTFLILSAYGTTGLSTMPLADVTFVTKWILIITMFIGQLGMSTTLSQLKSKKVVIKKTYVEEKVSLG